MGFKNFIISKNISRIKRQVQFHNFETAKTIGILFSIQNKSVFDTVKKYYNSFEPMKKNAHALAYVNKADEIGQKYFGQNNFNFYSEKHITKFGKLKDDCITDFIKQDFDILINLTNENNFYIEYVFALSKAKFKVSGIIDCKYSDLNINFDKNKDLNYFISQINHYLSTIKKA